MLLLIGANYSYIAYIIIFGFYVANILINHVNFLNYWIIVIKKKLYKHKVIKIPLI
jgi:hypothetical protein